jgi:hypothetical protein
LGSRCVHECLDREWAMPRVVVRLFWLFPNGLCRRPCMHMPRVALDIDKEIFLFHF